MKINSIILENFGSYEGRTEFITSGQDGKNIVLIGGKNGAGKTTLFTAMRLCLYGFMSMGYKSHSAYYSRAIAKLINNTAKLSKPAVASVIMNIGISNGHEMDQYTLDRTWTLNETVTEEFHVQKNGIPLDNDEIADFEKFLLSIIPPELFNLYFFDGEKIADFFLEEGGNARIKGAFLTLCGYDTFDIMSKNFKRISKLGGGASIDALDDYLSAKEHFHDASGAYEEASRLLDECVTAIIDCEAELKVLEENYAKGGGITKDEWDEYLAELKTEEKKRETDNAWLKRIANDYLPFLMIKDRVMKTEEQLFKEINNKKYADFCEVLDEPSIKQTISELDENGLISQITDMAYSVYGNDSENILDLSFESGADVLASIKDILEFDTDRIFEAKKEIKESIAKSAKIRKLLDECTIDSVQVYMQRKNVLLETKNQLLTEQIELSELVREKELIKSEAETDAEKKLLLVKEELKKESISDISSRAILMLDDLQKVLYHKQIERIENTFRKEINLLMRKTKFIDDIKIDDDFNIHIYRRESFSPQQLIKIISTNREGDIENFAETEAYDRLREISGRSDDAGIIEFLKYDCENDIRLPVEIEKTSLSNGEKQIFIMALYHSLVQLCNREVPFVIDTPFARIDTEHRRNISEHFFGKLNGQVFILSTNEEINTKHVGIMRDKIAVTYMLENTDNTKTSVLRNSYFEE